MLVVHTYDMFLHSYARPTTHPICQNSVFATIAPMEVSLGIIKRHVIPGTESYLKFSQRSKFLGPVCFALFLLARRFLNVQYDLLL
jgi:hypothetical protein